MVVEVGGYGSGWWSDDGCVVDGGMMVGGSGDYGG